MKSKRKWAMRIVEHSEVNPKKLLANPYNYRIHPEYQQEALQSLLEEVGWIDEIMVNKRTNFVVDGHLRVALAIQNEEPIVPVAWIDVSEDEELLILASFDPLAAAAQIDFRKQDELLSQISAPSQTLKQFFHDLVSERQKFDIEPDERRKLIDKGLRDERRRDIDIIFVLSPFSSTAQVLCCMAVKTGWKYGFRSSGHPCGACQVLDAHRPVFIDNDFRKYDHELHFSTVKEWKPKYATVRDIMTREQCEEVEAEYYSFDQIMEWAEELDDFAENIIVIPKYDCISDIPDKYMLGYSVPTSYGGTPLPIEKFADHKVHLLGGSPDRQISYWQKIPHAVKSLDNNYVLMQAGFGTFWTPDGNSSLEKLRSSNSFPFVINPLYVSLAIGLGAMAGYFLKTSLEEIPLPVVDRD